MIRKKRYNMKGIVLYIISFIVLFIMFVMVLLSAYWNDNRDIKISDNKNQIIYFYKSDCTDCKQNMNLILNKKLFTNKDIVLVNLVKNSKNRHYIEEYALSKVPTIVELDSQNKILNYEVGTKEVNQYLKKIGN